MRLKLKTVVTSFAVVLLCTIVVLPWAFYWLALSNIDGRPASSNNITEQGEINAIWASQERTLSQDRLGDITPYWFYAWLTCAFELRQCKGDEPKNAMSLMASYVAIWYLRDEHFTGKGTANWHAAHASLTIWLQRHMSPTQLVNAYAETHRRITLRSSGSAQKRAAP
jgi:hypothetical protein